ncbi:MAG: hypothetical protein IJZ74_09565 [Clostridia bacterium]|nr:hypothetical protein [Clostridia bacterium]
MELLMISKILMGASALICIWFIIRGLMLAQLAGANDGQTLWLNAVVRQVKPKGRYDSQAVLTLNVDEAVVHVDCLLPGPWMSRKKPQVTDLVRVLWRRGETKAVAEQTIKDGQTMLILGFAALALIAVLYVLLF